MDKLFAAHLRYLNQQRPKQAIVSFQKQPPPPLALPYSAEPLWMAELSCGHLQPVRHQPPFFNRPWVMTAAGRTAMLGCLLACKHCQQPSGHVLTPQHPKV